MKSRSKTSHHFLFFPVVQEELPGVGKGGNNGAKKSDVVIEGRTNYWDLGSRAKYIRAYKNEELACGAGRY